MKFDKKSSLIAFTFTLSLLTMGAAQAASTLHFKGGCTKTCSGDWYIVDVGGTTAYQCDGSITYASPQCSNVAPPTKNNMTQRKPKKTKQSFKVNGDPVNKGR